MPDDKCLPPTLDSIAPKAVSNHLWTLPYFQTQDEHPPPRSPWYPIVEIGPKVGYEKPDEVSHALPLLHLRASLERCRPHMHALRSIDFENLSIQGIHALSDPSSTTETTDKKTKDAVWSASLALSISMIKWWTLPEEHWPFFEGKNGTLPIPGAEHPTAQRSREANLKLRGWQVLTRWLRGIQSSVQTFEFGWVEPRVILPPAPGAGSPTSLNAEPFISSPSSPGLSDVKDFPLRPLSLYQTLEHDKTIVLSYSRSVSERRRLHEKKSQPEMSTRAAIESYATPPVPITPQMAWRVAEGPIPLLLNDLKELESPLTWPVLSTLSLRNIHLSATELNDFLTSAPSLRSLSVSPEYIDQTELPLLDTNFALSRTSSLIIDNESSVSKASLSKRSVRKTTLHRTPSQRSHFSDLPPISTDTSHAKDDNYSQRNALKPIDLPLFLLVHQSPNRHKLHKLHKRNISNNSNKPRFLHGFTSSNSSLSSTEPTTIGCPSAKAAPGLSFKSRTFGLGSAITSAMTSTAPTTCFGTGMSLADFGSPGMLSGTGTISIGSTLSAASSRTDSNSRSDLRRSQSSSTPPESETGLANILEGKEGFSPARTKSGGGAPLAGIEVGWASAHTSDPLRSGHGSLRTGYSVSVSAGSGFEDKEKKAGKWKRFLGLSRRNSGDSGKEERRDWGAPDRIRGDSRERTVEKQRDMEDSLKKTGKGSQESNLGNEGKRSLSGNENSITDDELAEKLRRVREYRKAWGKDWDGNIKGGGVREASFKGGWRT